MEIRNNSPHLHKCGAAGRQRGHDGGAADGEHPPRHELPRVSAEEALAERQESAHQVHHGPGSETVLNVQVT